MPGDKLIKITCHLPPQKYNSYLRMPSPSFLVLKRELEMYLFTERQFPVFELRVYWMDGDDEIDVVNQNDYEIFLNKFSNQNMHLHIATLEKPTLPNKSSNSTDAATATTADTKSTSANDPTNFIIHDNVSCDICGLAPLVGFRYKCIQCPNFDLCQRCEAAHKHTEHMMLRMPHNNCPNVVDTWITNDWGASSSSRRHSHRHHKRSPKSQCPFAAGVGEVVGEAAAAAEAACGAAVPEPNEGARHGRKHHKRQMRQGLFSHFYNIMQDLAETNAATAAASAAETQTSAAQTAADEAVERMKTAAAAATAAAATAATAAATAAATGQETKEQPNTNQEAQATSNTTTTETTNSVTEQLINAEKSAANTATPTPAPRQAEKSDVDNEEQQQQQPTSNKSTTPPTTPAINLENLSQVVPPEYMRAGIEILNNFSEMFAKMLDPVEGGNGDAAPPSSSTSSGEMSNNSTRRHSSVASGSSVASLSTTTSIEAKETEQQIPPAVANLEEANSKKHDSAAIVDANVSAVIVTPTSTPLKSRANSEDGDWQVIDNAGNAAPSSGRASSILDMPNTSIATSSIEPISGGAPTSSTSIPNFVQLGEDLRAHIAQEEARSVTTQTAQEPIVSTSTVSTNTSNGDQQQQQQQQQQQRNPLPPQEKRSVPIYHADQRINNAVLAMMSMGFSNEGAWLTQLLESVDGNIAAALDVMSASQRNRN